MIFFSFWRKSILIPVITLSENIASPNISCLVLCHVVMFFVMGVVGGGGGGGGIMQALRFSRGF